MSIVPVIQRIFSQRPYMLLTSLSSTPSFKRRLYPQSSQISKRFLTDDSRSAVNHYTLRTHTCGEINETHVGERVQLYGWVQHIRGGQFIVIKDAYGKVQLLGNPKKFRFLKKLRLDSVIKVAGVVHKRPPGEENPDMTTGGIEIHIEEAELISRVNQRLPMLMHQIDHTEAREDSRIKYRYLYLRRDQVQRNLRLRSKYIQNLRNLLIDRFKFIEVETPTLFRRTPGGAQEFVVPTRTPDHFFALVQSPQILKQLLMIGGIDRYFQIARCYRDEASRTDRQPEFTQLDLELSFTNMEYVMNLVEDLLRLFWKESDLPGSLPEKFPRMSHSVAIKDYGSDKPDLRMNLKIRDVSKHFQSSSDMKWSSLTIPGQMDLLEGLNANEFSFLPHLSSFLKCQLYGLHVTSDLRLDVKCAFNDSSNNQHDLFSNLEEALKTEGLREGDFILLSHGPYPQSNLILGKILPFIAEFLHDKGRSIYQGDEFQFLWVTDFPLFEMGEDGALESAHHPFTAPIDEHQELLYTHPEKVKAQHYDLVLNGQEIAGGSIRINNSQMQKYILEKLLKVPISSDGSSSMDFFIQALESGCPPHGGIAFGLDRFISILCGASNIRDVIAFPKNNEGRDLLSRAPAPLDDQDRMLYHLFNNNKEKS